jgi:hypothetical protein
MSTHIITQQQQLATVLEALVHDGGAIYVDQCPAAPARLRLIALLAGEGVEACHRAGIQDGNDCWPEIAARSLLTAVATLADVAASQDTTSAPGDPAEAVHVLVTEFAEAARRLPAETLAVA